MSKITPKHLAAYNHLKPQTRRRLIQAFDTDNTVALVGYGAYFGFSWQSRCGDCKIMAEPFSINYLKQ